jgi:predicted 2-oxoglutarate/Fe(II)-dependent dioxygenase YbiX
MQATHLGSGIILFKNAFDVDSDFFSTFMERMYGNSPPTIYGLTDDDPTVKNNGGYEFNSESLKSLPIRHTNTLYQGISDDDKEFVQLLEDSIYKCLVEYCRSFPVVMETVTWRTRGYFIEYHKGMSIGSHSDCAIAYEPNSFAEINTFPIHNTLTSSLVLNDDYEGGEIGFAPWGISIKPPKGSILIYPSSFIGCHSVAPLESGVRFAYLSWFAHGLTSHLDINSQSTSMDAQYSWMRKLREDVGYVYQKQVYVGDISNS